MEKIELATWAHKDTYLAYAGMDHPFYTVTFRLDVTGAYQAARRREVSFYYLMVWACTKALNQIEAFRVVKRGEELYLLPQRSPSFTDLRPGEEAYYIVTLPPREDPLDFCQAAQKQSQEQSCFVEEEKEGDDLIYFSCLPWLDLTAFTSARDLSTPAALDDNIPRITWGRYQEEGGRKKLGLCVEANHRFIDGFHIGLFARKLEEILQALCDES